MNVVTKLDLLLMQVELAAVAAILPDEVVQQRSTWIADQLALVG